MVKVTCFSLGTTCQCHAIWINKKITMLSYHAWNVNKKHRQWSKMPTILLKCIQLYRVHKHIGPAKANKILVNIVFNLQITTEQVTNDIWPNNTNTIHVEESICVSSWQQHNWTRVRSPHLLCKIVKYDLINGIISRVHGLNNSITTYSVFKWNGNN